MSYPHKIHVLVVEDEPQVVEYYRQLFQELGNEFALAPPCFAHSFNDAVEELRKPVIYHLLVLDLCLPSETRMHAAAGIEPGLQLVREAADREAYPIPALLVVSGRLGLARFGELSVQLTEGFSYGRLVNKGVDVLEALRDAIGAINRYTDVGIHVDCGSFGTYPTISPRDEDLLRRCVLRQEHCLGLQLAWWSADRTHPLPGQTASDVWTKVLMGRFLLDDGTGLSRPAFFKLEPAGNADVVRHDANLMEHKLPHIKLCGALVAGKRSLLVTQKVGSHDSPPVTPEKFLSGDPSVVIEQLPGIVGEVADQLVQLGEARQTQRSVGQLLWEHHCQDNLMTLYTQYLPMSFPSQGESPGREAGVNPIELYAALKQCSDHTWVGLQTNVHGDLNVSNVALDDVAGKAHAFIFDASGMRPAINVRDLANLEVTSLLHHSMSLPNSLVGFCASLFMAGTTLPPDGEIPDGPPMARNTMKMIIEIRRRAWQMADAEIYALMVFDCALIQLGCLAYGLSGNKIENPALAALLVWYSANWLCQVAPGFISGNVMKL